MADYLKYLTSPSKFLLTNPFSAAALAYFDSSPAGAGSDRPDSLQSFDDIPPSERDNYLYMEGMGLIRKDELAKEPIDDTSKKKAPAIVKKKAPIKKKALKRSLSKNLITAKNRQKEEANKLLSKNKKTKSADILSGGEPRTIAKAKKMGKKTFRDKRGKKLAAVTKEELAKSGLSLRDYLNKQRGLTRRKKSGGIVKRNIGGPVRGVGQAMRGFGKAKYSKKMY
tara:strand:+ start:1195 stop:1869 length:675 start_codon:yes stop_codon:yes gene_type:complete